MNIWKIDDRYVVADTLNGALEAYRHHMWASGRDGELPPRYCHGGTEKIQECIRNTAWDMASIEPRHIEKIGGDVIDYQSAVDYHTSVRKSLESWIHEEDA